MPYFFDSFTDIYVIKLIPTNIILNTKIKLFETSKNNSIVVINNVIHPNVTNGLSFLAIPYTTYITDNNKL